MVRTRNSEDLSDQVDRLVENGSSNNVTFSRVFKVSARPKMKAEKKILALHESVQPALLDELIKRFDRVRVTTNPSAKDIRYTLDYIVHAYWIGIYGLNTGRRMLESYVLLVVKDVIKDETVLEQALNIQKIFMEDFILDNESILDGFYQEAARTVAQEVSPLFE